MGRREGKKKKQQRGKTVDKKSYRKVVDHRLYQIDVSTSNKQASMGNVISNKQVKNFTE